MLTATVAAASWLRRQGAERALLLLPETAREDFPGLETGAEEPEYVVVGDLGDAWSYQILNRAFRALKGGARLVAIQRNRFWASDDGLAGARAEVSSASSALCGKSPARLGPLALPPKKRDG